MQTYRWVKTSKSDFLEMRENNAVIMRLTKEIKMKDIVVLFTANDVVHVYALEHGDAVVPENYGMMAERARALVARAGQGTIKVMGQLWMNRVAESLSIANVSIGSVANGRFTFSTTGLTNLGCRGVKVSESERSLNRVARLEILHEESC